MLGGYVTYDELKLLTGFPDNVLSNFIRAGIEKKCLTVTSPKGAKKFRQYLYSIEQVEKLLKAWL